MMKMAGTVHLHRLYLTIYSNTDILQLRGFDGAITAKARNRHCVGRIGAKFRRGLWLCLVFSNQFVAQKMREETTMQTLHDMLKHQPKEPDRPVSPKEDLRGRYSKIGISAVAAATQFNRNKELPPAQVKADRSSARGWSGHR
jgi:hypothetical protein